MMKQLKNISLGSHKWSSTTFLFWKVYKLLIIGRFNTEKEKSWYQFITGIDQNPGFKHLSAVKKFHFVINANYIELNCKHCSFVTERKGA